MSGPLFAAATLAHWAGWVCAVAALYSVLLRALGAAAWSAASGRRVGLWASAGALLLLISLPVVRSESEGMWLPLVWPSLPWTGWLGVAATVLCCWRLWEALASPNPDAVRAKLRGAALCLAAASVFGWLFWIGDAPIAFLRGRVWVQPASIVAVVLLIGLAALVMRWTGRRAQSQRPLQTAATQIMLASGALVFCIPFAWLLVTSFKEDRDMASRTGIVWVPKVQEHVPYFDPNDPLYAFRHEGRSIQGTVLSEREGGRVVVDVFRPISMRGRTFVVERSALSPIPKQVPVVAGKLDGAIFRGMVVEELRDGRRTVEVLSPVSLEGRREVFQPTEIQPVRHVGLRWQNYTEALEYLPPETEYGLVYVKNSLFLVVMNVFGTVLSSALVAYAFARIRFPGNDLLFKVLLSTMMLPGAVTLLPKFLIFRSLGWIDSLSPLWVPAFFANAFNVFLFRQFFLQIPNELEDAAKIDGCNHVKTFWSVMLPQIMPALAVIAIGTFIASWNDFMGPLIYVNSPEIMPISYAVQLYNGERSAEPGMLMAFVTMAMLPVMLLFAFAQRYFIENVTLSGLGGR